MTKEEGDIDCSQHCLLSPTAYNPSLINVMVLTIDHQDSNLNPMSFLPGSEP